MKPLLTLFLLLITNTIHAQNSPTFTIGSEVVLFADQVKLRQAPNVQSEVLELLPIGSSLQIKELTEVMHTYNGISSRWYGVEDSNGTKGYVLGGLISLLHKTESFSQSGSYFVFGKRKEKQDSSLTIEIRKVKAHQILDTIRVPVIGRNLLKIQHFNNKGLEKADDIIVVEGFSEACGETDGQSYIVHYQNQLLLMGSTIQSGDGGGHESTRFTFPTDKGGKKDVIRYHSEIKTLKDEATNWHRTLSEDRELIWDGTKLVPEDYDAVLE